MPRETIAQIAYKCLGLTDNKEINALILERSKLETKALKVRIPGNSIQKNLIAQIDELSVKIKTMKEKLSNPELDDMYDGF